MKTKEMDIWCNEVLDKARAFVVKGSLNRRRVVTLIIDLRMMLGEENVSRNGECSSDVNGA